MSIETIASISNGLNISDGLYINELDALNTESRSSPFADWLSGEINAVNQQIQTAEVKVQKLAMGEEDNLHQVMLSLEKAKLGFELALQVRNKLLEGYQEIMRMQV